MGIGGASVSLLAVVLWNWDGTGQAWCFWVKRPKGLACQRGDKCRAIYIILQLLGDHRQPWPQDLGEIWPEEGSQALP